MRTWATIVAALLVAGVCPSAAAQSQASPQEEALIQFEQGKEFFNDSKFEQAAIALSRAYELRPSPKILYYLGLAEAENGNYARAYEAYDRYLDEGTAEDPLRLAEVRSEMAKLATRIGHVSVQCASSGAKVQVDGETRGTTPLSGPINVAVGSHEIEVVLGVEVLLREVVRVAGGQAISLEVIAAPVAAEPATATVDGLPASAPPPALPAPRRRVWTYVVGGVALATGMASGVLGGMALSKEDDLRGRCAGSLCSSDLLGDRDSLESLSLATDILWISAAAMGATAIVLFFVEGQRAEEPRALVSPAAFGGGGGLTVAGRF